LESNTIGSNNIAIGGDALGSNTEGHNNIATGRFALESNTIGNSNIAFGYHALAENVQGNDNISLGFESQYNGTTGSNNISIGKSSLYNNNSGFNNIAIGDSAVFGNMMLGSSNIGIGKRTLFVNKDGNNNIAVGDSALATNTTGGENIAIGNNAMDKNTTGMRNTAIGSLADVGSGNLTNATAIGYGAIVTVSNKVRIGNSSVTVIEGQVAYTTSDGRFKKNVKENVPGLDFITGLKPYTYQYKSYEMDKFLNQNNPRRQQQLKQTDYTEAESMVHMGFIAQDVEKLVKEKGLNISLVHTPANASDNYSIAYGELVVPLVKAVQEQQSIIENQNSKIKLQDERINKLEAMLKKMLENQR
jgi:trimeric autotransporter adhesin